MRQIILFILLLFSLNSSAQFFYYSTPQIQRQQPQQEKYTAPKFKGGEKGMENFITKHFRNPIERQNAEGKIVVAVIVSEKGKVAETHIVRSMSDELNAEAMRVAKKMKFKPAKQGKKKVKSRVDITFPIRHGRLSFLKLNTIDV